MQIVERKIKDLRRADYNPRYATKKAKEDLKQSMLTFGQVDPIIININPERFNIIIGGHQRVEVWEELGNDTIFCIELNLSEAEERELNIRLNKNGGEFDISLLKQHFAPEELKTWGFESFEIGEFDFIIDDPVANDREPIEVEEEPEEKREITVTVGETKDAYCLTIDFGENWGGTVEQVQEIKDKFFPEREFWEMHPKKENVQGGRSMRILFSPKGREMPDLIEMQFCERKVYFL